MIIGIDFGNSKTVVAFMDGSKAKIIFDEPT